MNERPVTTRGERIQGAFFTVVAAVGSQVCPFWELRVFFLAVMLACFAVAVKG